MDLNTEITSAARRITTHINGTPSKYTILYDDSGYLVLSHPTGMRYINPVAEPTHAVRLSGRLGLRLSNQREIQDLLDAHTHARQRSNSRFGYNDLRDRYLLELAVERKGQKGTKA